MEALPGTDHQIMAEEDKKSEQPRKIGQGRRQKLAIEEAGFRRGQGLSSYRCGECFFYEQGKCRVVKVNPNYGDVCNNFEPDRKGKTSATQSPQALVRRSTIDLDEFNDYPAAYVKRRKFTSKKRKKLAKSGKALPHGGFPIENCGDVANAIRAIGRAKDRGATIAHIKSRHGSLGCKKKLPASWGGGKKKKSMADLEDGVIAVGPLRKLVPVVRANKLLLITKVAEDKQTGIRRWFARASGIERDLYNERMSVVLFNDFINRVERRDEVPEPFSSKAWNGGLPYLGIAHYLDMGGLGIVGTTEQLYTDGDLLKAKGQFKETPMALAAYKSIYEDIANNVPLEQRVRISIAFIDWAHDHEGKGGGEFKRRSLTDRCSLCADGRGEKVYLAGQLVHLALTRIPAYTTATIELQEE